MGHSPASLTGIEGVVGSGDDGFAPNRQQLHHLVLMDNGGQDGVVVHLAGGFVVDQDIVVGC